MNVRVHEADPGVVCLPGPHGVTTHLTMCGWAEVGAVKTDSPATCESCLAAVAHVFELAKSRGAVRGRLGLDKLKVAE